MAKKAKKIAHYENGLIEELRSKAAKPNKKYIKDAVQSVKRAAQQNPPASVFSRLSRQDLKKLISD